MYAVLVLSLFGGLAFIVEASKLTQYGYISFSIPNISKNENVCGSDKKIYKNHCDFLKANCHADNRVRRVTMGYCSGEGPSSELISIRPIPTVCANDNKNYLKCELLKKVCNEERPPKLVHYGKCGNCSPKNVCHWSKQKSNKNMFGKRPGIQILMGMLKKNIWDKKRIRASDGQMYNKCEFQVARCEKFNSDGVILQGELIGRNKQGKKQEPNNVNV